MMKKKQSTIVATIMLGMIVCARWNTTEKVLAISTVETDSDSKVIFDQDGIYVEYRGIEEYSSQSWIINLYVENNTQNDFYLSLRDVLVNGNIISIANNGQTIQTGSKYLSQPNFDMVLDTDKLTAYGISEVNDIGFEIYVATEMFGDEIVTTPFSIDNINKPVPDEVEELPAGKVLLDQDNIHVEYLGIDEYSSQSWIVNLYAENNTDNEIYLALSDTLINGFSIKLSNNGQSIPSHAKYLASPNFDLIIDTEDLESYDIDSIETLTSTLSIRTSMFGDTIVETPVDLSSAEPDATKAEEEPKEEIQSESTADFAEIKKGDNNEIVVEIQQILINAGYLAGKADGAFGSMTEQAVKDFQTANGIDVTGIVNDETYSLLLQKKDETVTANIPEGLVVDEGVWDSWESTNTCSLFPFMFAAKKAGFTFGLPSGQQENYKVGTFNFLDGDSETGLDQTEFYYGVINQKIIYTGLSTDNEEVYMSQNFKEACIRLLLGYNSDYEAEDAVLNLSRERAEEIVNYCFNNKIKHCVVDDMRIRLIWNDTGDNYYSFHMEY